MSVQTYTYYQFSVRPCLNPKPRLFFNTDTMLDIWAENVFFNDEDEAIRYLKERLYIERETRHSDMTGTVMEKIEVDPGNGTWIVGLNEAVMELSPTIIAVV